jgi:hypothetical protein
MFSVDMLVCTRLSSHSCLTSLCVSHNYKGSPINVSGKAAEFRPPDNRHLVVHECTAFGPGEMQAIQDFITTRNNKSRLASERLHAIW